MKKSAHILLGAFTLLASLTLSSPASAQDAPPAPVVAQESGLYLTVFRSPATGMEYRRGRLSIYGGYYVTILKADGQVKSENTNFIRVGGSFYLRSAGWTPYVSPSVVFSMDDDWDNGVLTEVGVRMPVFNRVNLRVGAGVLSTFSGKVRVNPTIGLDVRLGAR